jgi:hypothetical protein
VHIPSRWLGASCGRGQSPGRSLAGVVVGEHGAEHGVGGGQVGLAHPVPPREPSVNADLGLAQDNLVSDVAAAEITWTHDHP